MSNWDTIFGWALITIAVWTMLAIGAAAAWSTSRRTHDRRTAADEYEASPYGPVRRFRNDLCMVATCNGTKAVDLGAGWIVCTDHARSLISGGDAA